MAKVKDGTLTTAKRMKHMDLPDHIAHHKTAQLNTVEHVESLAKLMDSQFKIPGIPAPLGLDTLIGFIPGIGDTIGLGVSGYIISRGAQLGLPKRKLLNMSFNVGIDWLIGLIPLIGDIFDWGWKANNRNAAIIRDHYETLLRVAEPIDVTPTRR